MIVKNKDLIITDPCYFAKRDDWGNSFDYDNYIISCPGFSQYEWEETGYGDGSPKLYNVPTNYDLSQFKVPANKWNDVELIGECGVDSGTFGVFLLDEVLKYNPEFIEKLPENCYSIINNFSGTVYPGYDDDGFTHYILRPDNPIVKPIITDLDNED